MVGPLHNHFVGQFQDTLPAAEVPLDTLHLARLVLLGNQMEEGQHLHQDILPLGEYQRKELYINKSIARYVFWLPNSYHAFKRAKYLHHLDLTWFPG